MHIGKKRYFLFLFFTMLFLPIFSVSAATTASLGWSPDNYTSTNLPSGTMLDIIVNLADWFLVIIGSVALSAFVVAGILYFTSAGDDGKMENAKSAMIAGIIGIIVALSGYVVIQAADFFLNAGFF